MPTKPNLAATKTQAPLPTDYKPSRPTSKQEARHAPGIPRDGVFISPPPMMLERKPPKPPKLRSPKVGRLSAGGGPGRSDGS